MKLIMIIFLFFTSISCNSNAKKTEHIGSDLLFIKEMPFESAKVIQDKYGSPTETNDITAFGFQLTSQQYININKHIFAEILIDKKTGQALEKIFFPQKNSNESNLQLLLSETFKNDAFEIISVKCRHNNEVLYINKAQNIFIATNESDNATVSAIGFSQPKFMHARLKDNQNKKCKY